MFGLISHHLAFLQFCTAQTGFDSLADLGTFYDVEYCFWENTVDGFLLIFISEKRSSREKMAGGGWLKAGIFGGIEVKYNRPHQRLFHMIYLDSLLRQCSALSATLQNK